MNIVGLPHKDIGPDTHTALKRGVVAASVDAADAAVTLFLLPPSATS